MGLAAVRPELFGTRVVGAALLSTSSGNLADLTFGLPEFLTRVRAAVLPIAALDDAPPAGHRRGHPPGGRRPHLGRHPVAVVRLGRRRPGAGALRRRDDRRDAGRRDRGVLPGAGRAGRDGRAGAAAPRPDPGAHRRRRPDDPEGAQRADRRAAPGRRVRRRPRRRAHGAAGEAGRRRRGAHRPAAPGGGGAARRARRAEAVQSRSRPSCRLIVEPRRRRHRPPARGRQAARARPGSTSWEGRRALRGGTTTGRRSKIASCRRRSGIASRPCSATRTALPPSAGGRSANCCRARRPAAVVCACVFPTSRAGMARRTSPSLVRCRNSWSSRRSCRTCQRIVVHRPVSPGADRVQQGGLDGVRGGGGVGAEFARRFDADAAGLDHRHERGVHQPGEAAGEDRHVVHVERVRVLAGSP